MAASTLERMRLLHEELEQLEQTMADAIENRPSRMKDAVMNDHFILNCTKRTQETSQKLMELYADKDGLRRHEISSMAGNGKLDKFYDSLNEIRRYYEKNPDTTNENVEQSILADLEPQVEFTGEERYGKYLDLHSLHEEWLNVVEAEADTPNTDYYSYLGYFAQCAAAPNVSNAEELRQKKGYKSYVEHLAQYLCGFHKRIHPLVDLPQSLETVFAEFLKNWHQSASVNGSQEQQIDLEQYNSQEELEALGLGTLKTELTRRGLKCGGSLSDRAKRLLAVKGLSPEQYPKKHVAKRPQPRASTNGETSVQGSSANQNGSHGQNNEERDQADDQWRTMAREIYSYDTGDTVVPGYNGLAPGKQRLSWCETLVQTMADLLNERVEATRNLVKRKQTRTYEELQQDYAEELAEDEEGNRRQQQQQEYQADDSDTDSDEEEPIYNPKKIPLGWDGKPIPFWLYKLHGLNHAFKCEICGDVTYYGPRNFQKHFSEWQHAEGMRALEIPNSKHFFGITRIAEAKALWQRLKNENQKIEWDPDRDEEFEDSEGNVLNRKTFEDLARQGLL
eukprot:gb/GECG01001456.1/.p1 GENE.gb/GECG01001456.1/~~gb/GECG01001456.1/.p1  ORF type:complete len:564 (+),score=105.25 gb/GECG01001456.1/:1-1692(+)